MQDGACPTSLATVDGWCTTLLDSKSRCSTSSFEHGIAGEVRRSSGTRGTVNCDLIHCVNTCQHTCPDTCQYSQQITTNHNSLQILCSLGTAWFPQQRRANATQLITAHLVWKRAGMVLVDKTHPSCVTDPGSIPGCNTRRTGGPLPHPCS